MNFSSWEFWLVLSIIFLIIEIFTPTFLFACIALGGFITSVIAFFGFNLNTQLFFFTLSTTISIFSVIVN